MNIHILKIYGIFTHPAPSIKEKQSKRLNLPLDLTELNTWHGFKTYFSSRKKALSHAKRELSKLDKNDLNEIYEISLQEVSVDKNVSVNLETFNAKLEPIYTSERDMDEPFFGVDKSKYKSGDYILYLENSQVICGIVGMGPWTKKEVLAQNLKDLDQYENCYYVIWHNASNPNDTHAHSHLDQCYIIKKVKDPSLYLSDDRIEILQKRFKEYRDYIGKRFPHIN